MKTEFLEGLGLQKDAIEKIMAENGKDITREQQKHADYDDVKGALKKAQDTIAGFGDVDAIKKDVEKYKLEAKTAKEDAEKKLKQLELTGLVKEYTSGKAFVNDFTKEMIEAKLLQVVSSEDAKGKSLDDIFKSITDGKENIVRDDKKPVPPVVPAMSGQQQKHDDGVTAAFARINPGLKLD